LDIIGRRESSMKLINLIEVASGKNVLIVKIEGGKSFLEKADSLGLRLGVKIKKLSTQMMHGPVTIQVGSSKLALGRGMAGKILVSDGDR
jgi:ferrous iron transport protein A